MQYPGRLIPRLCFKHIQTDLSAYFLCRAVSDKALLTPVNGMFSEEMICSVNKELFDYSTNLLGVFLPEDTKIVLIGDDKKLFYSYWDFEEEVTIPVFGKDFEVAENRICFFFPIASLHQKICIPMPSTPNSQGDKLTANVIHTPTRSNYWHFSIRWEDQNGEFKKYTGSAWQKRICATMMASLQEFIVINMPDSTPIPENIYSKDIF